MNKKMIFCILLCLGLCGCTVPDLQDGTKTAAQSGADTGFMPAQAGIYDSVDTAVVVASNKDNSTLTLKNLDIGKQYTLNYDGTTDIHDKYEQAISMEQIQPGDIVDVTFYKERKRLNSIMLSPAAWSNENVSQFTFGRNGFGMTVGGEDYALDEHAAVLSDGVAAEVADINPADVLKVGGIDHTIVSIVISRGHGYLRLTNDDFFIGGWVEVGQALIQPITEGMLLTVPEGSYQVLVSNKGTSGTKEVTVGRNREVELDIGDLKGEEVKQGQVIFAIQPKEAAVSVDGKEIDVSRPVILDYGIHQMAVKADGYRTIRQYLKVGEQLATISVEMEAIEEETEESVSSNSVPEIPPVSSNALPSLSSNTVLGTNAVNKVRVEGPVGAEVYLDGNYVGIAPAEFKKEAGSHTITLRKSGYQTRSYTIQVNSENKDISYSFSELVKAE